MRTMAIMRAALSAQDIVASVGPRRGPDSLPDLRKLPQGVGFRALRPLRHGIAGRARAFVIEYNRSGRPPARKASVRQARGPVLRPGLGIPLRRREKRYAARSVTTA